MIEEKLKAKSVKRHILVDHKVEAPLTTDRVRVFSSAHPVVGYAIIAMIIAPTIAAMSHSTPIIVGSVLMWFPLLFVRKKVEFDSASLEIQVSTWLAGLQLQCFPKLEVSTVEIWVRRGAKGGGLVYYAQFVPKSGDIKRVIFAFQSVAPSDTPSKFLHKIGGLALPFSIQPSIAKLAPPEVSNAIERSRLDHGGGQEQPRETPPSQNR